jgi:hypothetical protein
MEFRKIMGNIHANGNQAGTFVFARAATGLLGINSGSPVASFLLGAVDHADVAFRAVDSWYPRQHAWVFHGGDTWRANQKLTLDMVCGGTILRPRVKNTITCPSSIPPAPTPAPAMTDDPPFYSPNRRPAPPREPQPGEEVWRLRNGAQVQSCELRNSERPARAGMW